MAKTKKVFGSMYQLRMLYLNHIIEIIENSFFCFLGRNKITPYNKFIKTELPKVKIDNPEISHKEAFKIAAQRWKDSPENPKNVQEPSAE